jgi:phosphate butyryltransferase
MKTLTDLIDLAKNKGTKIMAVAAADDVSVLKAVQKTYSDRIINPVLIGNYKSIITIANDIGFDIKGLEIIDEPDSEVACKRAVKLINEGKAEILMKGMVSTAPFLKAVLNSETGIREKNTLYHLALCEGSYYHKIIGVTDVAMNIAPTFTEKVSIITNVVDVFHKLGYNNPKVAILAPIEGVNEKMESTIHAAMLTMMNKRKQINGCTIDGPLAFDNAISFEAARHKGIESDVAGDADILLVPDLNSGNILYKALVFAGLSLSAAIIVGARVPIVLTSRADSEQSKLLSIALAVAL